MCFNHPIIREAKEIAETEDINELAAKLTTGKWIAIAAMEVSEEPLKYRFCLIRLY